MANSNSLAQISRRICRNLLSNQRQPSFHITKSFFSTEQQHPSAPEYNNSDSPTPNELPILNSDSDSNESNSAESPPSSSSSSFSSSSSSSATPPPRDSRAQQRMPVDATLEGGLDVGIFKAILVGQVGQSPLQKRLRNGRMVTLTSVGTGGIRNERIPFANEEPREYADRCNVQWHRVMVYQDKLAEIVMKNAKPGSILYLEGNIETKIFTDQVTGLVKRVREIAIRQNGRVVFLGNGNDFNQPSTNELRGVGYF